MLKHLLFSLLLITIGISSFGQQPRFPRKTLPDVKNTNWLEHGWIQPDSGLINAPRDTNFLPRFIGTQVVWPHAGIDTTTWLWTGARWTKAGSSDLSLSSVGTAYKVLKGNSEIKSVAADTASGFIYDSTATTIIGRADTNKLATKAFVNSITTNISNTGSYDTTITVNTDGTQTTITILTNFASISNIQATTDNAQGGTPSSSGGTAQVVYGTAPYGTASYKITGKK